MELRVWRIAACVAVLASECSAVAAPVEVLWTRLSPAVSASPRTGHAMVFDRPRNAYVLFGGSRAESRLGDTWEFQGSTWVELSGGGEDAPSPVTAHAMVYDASRDRTVLFGGQLAVFDATGEFQTEFNGDVYEFDGSHWSRVDVPGIRPAARAAHAMAYDSRRGLVWLFGGRRKIDANLMELLGDTWCYDGSVPAWSEVASASKPGARESSGLVYDASRDRLVLFGGGLFGDRRTNETWELDPAVGQWSIVTATSAPSPRQNFGMAYLGRGRTLLFGGSRVDWVLDNETWIYDGESWLRLSPRSAPAPRASTTLAADPVLEEGLLFGGFDSDPLGDTWKIAFAPTPTPEPTVTPTSPPTALADLSGDGRLDALDVFVFAEQWSTSPSMGVQSPGPNGDLSRDGRVEATDLLMFIAAWANRDRRE